MNYYESIKEILINNEVTKRVKDYSKNKSDLDTYYNVGKLLSEAGKHYGEGIIKEYSKRLTNELGKGYGVTNLKRMRQFYLLIEKGAPLAHQMTWSNYVELLPINDINIVKFTAKNDYRTSVNKDKTHLFNYLRLVIFFLVFLFYMSFKFGYFMLNIQSMSNFIDVYNITQNCQTNTLYTVDVIKSYLFDSNIQILDNIDNPVIFINTYKSISDKLEQMIIETSRTPSFLEGQYQQKFREYLNSDFTEIIKNKNIDYISYYKEGLKKSIMRQYDILKYISLRRLTYNISEDSHRLLNETEWIELNNLVENIIRPWFIGLVQTLNERFEDFYDGTRLVQISVFIALLVVIILIYFIMWRNYEESLKSLLKISFDLINLIPEEIKYIIVSKLNE